MDVIAMFEKKNFIECNMQDRNGSSNRFMQKNKKRRSIFKYLLSVDVIIGKENLILKKLYASETRRIEKIGLLLSAQIQLWHKKKSFVSMDSAVRSRYFQNM